MAESVAKSVPREDAMRRTLAILLSILLLVPGAPAQTLHDWSNVEKLKQDAPVLIQLWTGEKVRGHFINVSDDILRLAAYDFSSYGDTYLREISRADIRRIELVRRDQNLPNPRSWAIGGALIGGAAGVGLGIQRDISEKPACGGACWFLDGAAAAGLGAMTGLMAAGVVEIGHVFRHNKLIYEDGTMHRLHN